MASDSISKDQTVLFTRQRHEAKRAGLHWDYRIVIGDKAYSWATKKEMPEPGKAIVLFEQPIHTSHYALTDSMEIPDGNYGAGKVQLDYVRKARLKVHAEQTFTLHMQHDGKPSKFLLKKLTGPMFKENGWLFKNLGYESV